jgi:hypothetical protein
MCSEVLLFDHVLSGLTIRVPPICMLCSCLFQEFVSYFAINRDVAVAKGIYYRAKYEREYTGDGWSVKT